MRFFIVAFCLFLFASCQEKRSKYILDEKSEMAQLMLDMHADFEMIQEKIKKGEDLGEFPNDYEKIVSAPMTQEAMRTESWEVFAKSMIEAEKSLYNAESENQIQAYQDAVNTCIACHQAVGCRGPLPKIRKLHWKPE